MFDVGRKSFVPPPKVDSSIIYMDCLAAPFPPVYGPMTLEDSIFNALQTLKNALCGRMVPQPIE